MKYNININQYAVIKLGLDDKLDIVDLSIFSMLYQFSNMPACVKMHEDGQYWCRFKHGLVQKELPILKLTTRQAIHKRMQKLVACGLLECHSDNQKNRDSFYKFTELAGKLWFTDVNENKHSVKDGLHSSVNGSSHSSVKDGLHDNNTSLYNNTNLNNNKEKGEQVPTPPLEDDVIDISLKTGPKEEKKKVAPKKKETAEDAPYYFEVTQVLAALSEKTGAKYRIPEKKSLLLRYGPYQIITARIKEGFILEDLISVIDSKCKEWLSSEKMCKYLIPSTLFSKSKFESYLASTSIKSTNSTNNGNQHPLITDREMHDKVLTLECTLKNLRIYTSNLDSLKDQEKLDVMQEIYTTHKNKQNELH